MQQLAQDSNNPPLLGVLWDESHLWGVLLVRFLQRLNVPYTILQGPQISQGELERKKIKLVIVPGGWASQKYRSLGPKGSLAIKRFIAQGGKYFGFCGGAGLALNDSSGLGLSHWQRKPLEQRLPNCSGHVQLLLDLSSQSGFQQKKISAPVWWPSQFQGHRDKTNILASYKRPDDDFWVADLPVQYLTDSQLREFETLYQINLDFDWLQGEPAIIEGHFGHGQYILSYAHLESPGSEQANLFFTYLLNMLLEQDWQLNRDAFWDLRQIHAIWQEPLLLEAWDRILNLIALGEENFLLCWRKSWLLGWKRGVPGLQINSLLALIQQIVSLPPTPQGMEYWQSQQNIFAAQLANFCHLFQELFSAIRLQIAKFGTSSPVTDPDNTCTGLRKQLIGHFPGQGGLTAELLQILSNLFILLLTRNHHK